MSVRIDSSLLLKVLEETPSKQNIMLMGKHGIGKSQILEDFYSKKGFKVVTLFLGQMSDPGDIIGIPHKNTKTGHTEFMPPYWFPTDDTPVVLFLDELNRARPEVLQTIMDLALNRKLAGRSLPQGSRIISAVNNGEEYQLTDLDPALVSRFNIYEFVPSVNDWLSWSQKNEIDQRIISFISENPLELDNHKKIEDTDNLEKTPDRRGWVRVSEIIKFKESLDQDDKNIVAGIIGGVSANRFFNYLDQNHLITAKELLFGKFGENLMRLVNYSTPQFAKINNSIFFYLENNEITENDKILVAENICYYFDYLEGESLRESMAHFANMFSSNDYPNSLVFIISECPKLYSKMTMFIAEIK